MPRSFGAPHNSKGASMRMRRSDSNWARNSIARQGSMPSMQLQISTGRAGGHRNPAGVAFVCPGVSRRYSGRRHPSLQESHKGRSNPLRKGSPPPAGHRACRWPIRAGSAYPDKRTFGSTAANSRVHQISRPIQRQATASSEPARPRNCACR